MKKRWHLVGLVVLALILAACAPKGAPVSAPPIAAPQAVVPVPAPAGPARSPEDIAWQKVVEAARREGRLTIYDGGVLGGDAALAVGNAFADTYGIKIDYISGVGADVVERLKVERRMGGMVGSVHVNSSTHVLITKQEGLTVPLLDLPELKKEGMWEIHPSTQDPAGHALTIAVGYHLPWLNTKLIRQEEYPRKYQDLLDPRWRDGKIVATDPAVNSGNYLSFVPLLNAKALDMGFIAALGKQNLLLDSSSPRAMQLISRGDAPILLSGPTSQGNRFVQEGAPILPWAMEEGTAATTTPIAVIEGAPQPNSARLFVNWLLTAEGQGVINRARLTRPIRKDVPDSSPVVVNVRRVLVPTLADLDQMTVMFKDRAFVDLWKKK